MTINNGLVACRGRGSIDRCMLPLILQFLKVEIVGVGKGDLVDGEISILIGGPRDGQPDHHDERFGRLRDVKQI